MSHREAKFILESLKLNRANLEKKLEVCQVKSEVEAHFLSNVSCVAVDLQSHVLK